MKSPYAHPTITDEILKELELAERLKISHRTCVMWREQGRLPYVRIGRSIRYCWRDVIDHLRKTSPKGGDW